MTMLPHVPMLDFQCPTDLFVPLSPRVYHSVSDFLTPIANDNMRFSFTSSTCPGWLSFPKMTGRI